MPRAQLSPTSDGGSQSPRLSRPYALDQLIESVIIPFSSCLRSLDLDNTAVFGLSLTTILTLRSGTLHHLSIRGCKNVSLKYHIVPFLTMFALQYDRHTGRKVGRSSKRPLALTSLYTYRCRHHRRRPYLSDSLQKKDSDSEPTHELVNLCHTLGIWTDTAWCTTPAGRCYRRQGYVSQRGAPAAAEVYVVFDRLWRSRNWLGRSGAGEVSDKAQIDGRLWDTNEDGYQGEALGTGDDCVGAEGKTMPTHLRRTHRFFVENIRCDQCDEVIPERCEQCSVMMHCVGCRKTLCHSCAFDRPYPRRRKSSEQDPNLWWAPDAPISPCQMREASSDNPQMLSHFESNPNLRFHWCCAQPTFSGGGGITTGSTGRDDDRIRAVPLPKGKGWEDPEFTSEWADTLPYQLTKNADSSQVGSSICDEQSMRWLIGPPGHLPSFCPRNLCNDCYHSSKWKVSCKNCSRPLCVEHDLRGLRLRICGYRDLATEKVHLDSQDWPSAFNISSNRAYQRFAQNASPNHTGLRPGPQQTGDTASSNNQSSGASLSSVSPQRLGGNRDEFRTSPSESERSSRSSSPSSFYESNAKEPPRWTGCHSFFCPQIRDNGDRRERLMDGLCRRIAEEQAKAEAEERHARLRARASDVESILLGAMERRLFRKNRATTRQNHDEQLGSFLFNPFLDSEDEADLDVMDAAYATISSFDIEPVIEELEEDGIVDPGIGPAPPFNEYEDSD
ncbi:hypothetical protein KEM54_006246 [Ascosphaera aggregata]|nr:hypothetical protein KEM54_006246 [Ascosphaera aggregata]